MIMNMFAKEGMNSILFLARKLNVSSRVSAMILRRSGTSVLTRRLAAAPAMPVTGSIPLP